MTERIGVDHIIKDYGLIIIHIEEVGLKGMVSDLLRRGWSFSLRGNVRPRKAGARFYPARLIMQHKTSGIIAGSNSSGTLTVVPTVITPFTEYNAQPYNYEATISRFEAWLKDRIHIDMRYMSHVKQLQTHRIRFIPDEPHIQVVTNLEFQQKDIPMVMERIKELQSEETEKAIANIRRRQRMAKGSNSVRYNIEEIKQRIKETENVS